jgi:hypothetical protein
MPPSARRIKLDRKSLREPDEFQAVTTQAAAWVQAHRPVLVAAAIGAAALVAVLGGLGWWRGSRADAAAVRFQSAYDDYKAARWAQAADAFAGLGRDYGSTPYGRLAALYEAHALARKPDAAAAAATYERYLSDGPETDYLKQEALLGLGLAREATGDAQGAQRALEEAAALAGPFTTDARLALARQLEGAGQADKAREQYLAVLKDSPSASLREFLQGKVPPGDVPAAGADAP